MEVCDARKGHHGRRGRLEGVGGGGAVRARRGEAAWCHGPRRDSLGGGDRLRGSRLPPAGRGARCPREVRDHGAGQNDATRPAGGGGRTHDRTQGRPRTTRSGAGGAVCRRRACWSSAPSTRVLSSASWWDRPALIAPSTRESPWWWFRSSTQTSTAARTESREARSIGCGHRSASTISCVRWSSSHPRDRDSTSPDRRRAAGRLVVTLRLTVPHWSRCDDGFGGTITRKSSGQVLSRSTDLPSGPTQEPSRRVSLATSASWRGCPSGFTAPRRSRCSSSFAISVGGATSKMCAPNAACSGSTACDPCSARARAATRRSRRPAVCPASYSGGRRAS